MTPAPRFWPWWRWVLTGLTALALALTGYLGWHYLMGGSMIGCGGGSPCDQALSSRWSAIGGVLPVSGLAEGAYLAILAASFFIDPTTAAPVRRLAWRAMLVLSGAIAGSALWFIILQKWIIGAFCPYCMATHITGLLLAALVIWRAPKEFENASLNAPKNLAQVIRPLPTIGMTVAGLTLAGVLAVCQVAIAPPAAYRAGEAQEKLPALDPHAVPLVGSPDAPFVVTLFFDYKCPHCQQVHSMFDEVIHRYDGKLAFTLCPTPLNTKCNPYVPQDVDEFKDSCELTKVALAVWIAKRDAFPDFDRWMFSPEPDDIWHPRTLDAARSKAAKLVGQAKLDAALTDPWIEQYMQTSIQIYGHTARSGNAVPKLVFGSHWVIPQPNNVDDLFSVLQNSLAIPPPNGI